MSAYAIQLKDREGNVVGGIVLLDQGHRQLTCDWLAGCGSIAIVAILPTTPGSPPQLSCSAHLERIHGSIWAGHNPPKIRTYDATPILYRNDKVKAA